MAGQIAKMINSIIEQRAKGNDTIATITKAKLILKGIDPGKFDASSPDDPEIITKLKNLALDLNVTI